MNTVVNTEWLKEFACSFADFVEGADGEDIGRQLWNDQSNEWRVARAENWQLGYADAEAEAEAWYRTSPSAIDEASPPNE